MTATRRQKRARKERERAKKYGCRSGKVSYSDRIAAARALARIGAHQRGEARAYRCSSCTSWHLTSK